MYIQEKNFHLGSYKKSEWQSGERPAAAILQAAILNQQAVKIFICE